MLPGITEIHVMAHGNHDASFIVADRAPAWLITIFFVGSVGSNELRAGNLILVIKIIDGVEDRIVIRNFNNRTIRENPPHTGRESLPFASAVKIVAHEKAASQQEIAQLGGLQIRQIPVPDLD